MEGKGNFLTCFKVTLKLLIILIILYCPLTGYSTFDEDKEFRHLIQNNFLTIGGIYRIRCEVQDEFNVNKYSTGTNDGFILSRLGIEIDFKLTKDLRIHSQI